MKKLLLLLLILAFGSCREKQWEPKPDTVHLKAELDSIQKLDQKYRRMLGDTAERYGWNSPQMESLWKKQDKLDSANLEKVLKIIEQVDGYPGDSLVGYPTRKTAFFVLQHAPDSIQEKYLPLILKAAKTGQLDEDLAAMYHDRYLMHKGLPQLYGSQIEAKTIIDSVTGEKREIHQLYKIADTSKVDSLRKSMGMIPLEEYKYRNGINTEDDWL